MRRVLSTMLACALVLGVGNVAAAKKVPCKKIRAAVEGGKSPEQVATELGTRVQRVETCMKKKKDKAAGGAPAASPGNETDDE
jgi:hypothetical protein